MRRLAWLLRQHAEAWLAALALALLGVAAALQLAVLPPLQARVDALDADSVRLAMLPSAGDNATETAARELQSFYRHVDGGSLPDHLARLHVVAHATGITLRQGEYRLLRERDGRLRRYQVLLPMRGSYPALRTFVSAALQTLPNAALDQVSFERRRVDEQEVDAQVQLTLFLPEAGT